MSLSLTLLADLRPRPSRSSPAGEAVELSTSSARGLASRADGPQSVEVSASGSNRAFTMVELLVVVAIIGVLAAIMVPVARNMINNGRAAKDVNNLRAIGAGFMLYAQDNDMKLPPMSRVEWEWPFWSFLVAPYAGQPSPNEVISGVPYCTGIFRCPGGWKPHWISDYGANHFVLAWYDKKMPLARIPKPSSTILVANVGGGTDPLGKQYGFFLNPWNQYSLPDPTSPAPNGQWPAFIWNGETTFHALFVDGAVKSISKDDFRQNYKTYLGTKKLWDGL